MTTTTFKPRSLEDLFKHRNGEKIDHNDEDDEAAAAADLEVEDAAPEQPRASGPASNGGRSSAFLNAAERLKNRLTKFKKPEDRAQLSQKFKPSTTTTKATTTTTTTASITSSQQQKKKLSVKDLLASIPIDDGSSP